ncbi:MAG: phosphoribosylamine--glycine ligase [Candidatus Eisenbacteria sp.]|nr:phosphoribosylamine--glycine ligase [Candidatus Eisenbacteria bacterium]
MNILITGSGGREHVLAWALSHSSPKPVIYALPGNPGIAELGTLLDGDAADPAVVLAAVREMRIDLVVIGPEAPLVAGVADALIEAGIRVFGPSAKAAEIEGSKVFSKDLMKRNGIPTAGFEIAATPEEALELVARVAYPHVLKADGLAAGKGALIVEDRQQATEAVAALMIEKRFGEAGRRVIFEEFMHGEEMSVFAVASGERYVLLPPSQDYKRALDGDRGLNTGGMGAYAPVVTWNDKLEERVRCDVIEPTLQAMAREGCPYTGLLYAGLMIQDGSPRVVEFNCRFGDPEAQVVLPILEGDLLELLWEASDPKAGRKALPVSVGHDGRTAVCVVLASGGYPGNVQTGYPIAGISKAREARGALVFHAGTATIEGRLVTQGGRVLSVVGLGDSLPAAHARAYKAIAAVEFNAAFYRRDIGWRGMEALEAKSR